MSLIKGTERRGVAGAALISGQKALWKLELVRDRAGQLAPLKIYRPHPASGPVVTNVPRAERLKLPVAVASEIVRTDTPKPIPKPHVKPISTKTDYWAPTNPIIIVTAAEPTPLLYTDDELYLHPTSELCPSDNYKPPNYGRASMPPPEWKRTKIFTTTYQKPAPALGERCRFPLTQGPNEKYRYRDAHSVVPFPDTKPTTLDTATIEREIIRFSKPGYKLAMTEMNHFQQIYNYLARACIFMMEAGERSMKGMKGAYQHDDDKQMRKKKFWRDETPLKNIHTYATMETDPWPDAEEERLQREFDRMIKDQEEEKENLEKERGQKRWERMQKKKKDAIKLSGLSVLVH